MPQITIDTDSLTQEQVSKLLGISAKSVDNYCKLEINPLPFTPLADKKIGRAYKWSEVLSWYIARKVGQGPQKQFKPEDDLIAAKLVGQNLINQKQTLENRLREEELLEASDVEKVWSDTLVDIKGSLINTGHTCAIEIVDGMTYAQKKNLIDASIFSSLNTVIEKVTETVDNDLQ